MKTDTKILLGILGLTLLAVAVVLATAPKGTAVDPNVVNRGGEATGSAQPKMTLVEFSDFQCPACKSFEPYVNQLLEKHAADLRFVYRHFPLPQHNLALKAALAAAAASEQGKFWEYKKELFANQEKLKDDSFEEIAKKLNLDLTRFNQERDSSELLSKVQEDLKDGQKLNVNATPTFYLDGEKLNLDSFDSLAKAVESKR